MDQFDLSGLNSQLERTIRLLTQAEQSSSRLAGNLTGGGGGGGGSSSGISIPNLSGMFGTWSQNPSPGAAALGTGVGFLTGNPALGMGISNIGSAAIQTSQKAMSAYLGALPSQGAVLGRASSYYRATISQGGGMGMNAAMQSRTLDAFKGGGLSYAGADADVARYLSQRGMIGSSSAYLDVVKSTAYAGKYLNMDNMTAATAFEGMTSGSMSSNLLSMGIYTSDSKGQARSTGDIFGDIYSRLTAGQGKATVSQTLESIRRGKLGVSINNMGFSEAQKELFQQFAISKAKGQTLDFGNVDQLENLVGGQIYQGNRNPEGALQQINYQNTKVMKETTDAYINGLEAAIPAVKMFTEAMIAYGNLGGKAAASLQTTLDTIGASSGGKMAYGFAGNGDKGLQGLMTAIPGLSDLAGLASMPAAIAYGATFLSSIFNPDTYASNADSPIPRSTPISPRGGRRPMGGPSNGITLGQVTGQGGADGAGMTGKADSGTSIGRPVAGSITSGYGPRKSPITGENKTHNGIDIQASTGTTVRAAADGVVSYIGHNMDKNTGYGNYVTLDHDNGYQTRYAHLSKVSVQVKQRVRKGEKIGEVGETGAATGPHLHFEVEKNGSFIDPSTVMGKNVSAVSGNTKSSQDTRPAWMQAGAELVANRLGNSGYLPIEQSSAASTSITPPEPLSGGGSSAAAGKGASMGEGKAMLTLPKNRSFLDIDSLQTKYMGNRSSGSSSSGGKAGNNVTINVTVAQSTPAEARKLAEMVKQYIDDDANIGMMRNR
jgi:murein DD-endopeptidase MepM/ murein hydrolase activator NlpD